MGIVLARQSLVATRGQAETGCASPSCLDAFPGQFAARLARYVGAQRSGRSAIRCHMVLNVSWRARFAARDGQIKLALAPQSNWRASHPDRHFPNAWVLARQRHPMRVRARAFVFGKWRPTETGTAPEARELRPARGLACRGRRRARRHPISSAADLKAWQTPGLPASGCGL